MRSAVHILRGKPYFCAEIRHIALSMVKTPLFSGSHRHMSKFSLKFLFQLVLITALTGGISASAKTEDTEAGKPTTEEILAEYRILEEAKSLRHQAGNAAVQGNYTASYELADEAWRLIDSLKSTKVLKRQTYLKLRLSYLDTLSDARMLAGLDSSAESRGAYRLSLSIHGDELSLQRGWKVALDHLEKDESQEAYQLASNLFEIASNHFGPRSDEAVRHHDLLLTAAIGVLPRSERRKLTDRHRGMLLYRTRENLKTLPEGSYEHGSERIKLAHLAPPEESIEIAKSLLANVSEDENRKYFVVELIRRLAANHTELGDRTAAEREHLRAIKWFDEVPNRYRQSDLANTVSAYAGFLLETGERQKALGLLEEHYSHYLGHNSNTEEEALGTAARTYNSGQNGLDVLSLALINHHQQAGDIESALNARRAFIGRQLRNNSVQSVAGLVNEYVGHLHDAAKTDGMKSKQNQTDVLFGEAFRHAQLHRSKTATAIALAAARSRSLGSGRAEQVYAGWEAATTRSDNALRNLERLAKAKPGAMSVDERERKRQEFSDERRQAREIASAAVGELTVIAPDLERLIAPRPIAVDDVQRNLLKDGEALIGFVLGGRPGQSPVIWVVTKNRTAWARSDLTMAQFESKIIALRRELSGGNRGADLLTQSGQDSAEAGSSGFNRQLAFELHNSLFSDPSVSAILSETPNWVLIPDGSFFNLPFTVLVTEEPQGRNSDPAALRSTSWLGIEKALTVVPSISALQIQRLPQGTGDTGSRPFFGMGDPDFDGEQDGDRSLLASASRFLTSRGAVDMSALKQLPRLPGTRREVEMMADILGAGADTFHLGSEANETNLAVASQQGVLKESSIVLLATHGLLAGSFKGVTEPALVLTPPGESPREVRTSGIDRGQRSQIVDDGILTASEAAQLNLGADWVILSACDTAAGDRRGGEGLSGLARSFLYAGAKSLLVSHWPVEDLITVRLTTEAIKAFRDGTASTRADALRLSMRLVLMDSSDPSYAHPRVWAPFQLVGAI